MHDRYPVLLVISSTISGGTLPVPQLSTKGSSSFDHSSSNGSAGVPLSSAAMAAAIKGMPLQVAASSASPMADAGRQRAAAPAPAIVGQWDIPWLNWLKDPGSSCLLPSLVGHPPTNAERASVGRACALLLFLACFGPTGPGPPRASDRLSCQASPRPERWGWAQDHAGSRGEKESWAARESVIVQAN